MRITVLKRDRFVFRLLYGKNYDHNDLFTHATILNVEMMYELVSIITSPFMMYSFMKYGYMFVFNGPMDHMAISAFIQFVMELITDFVSIYYEVHYHQLDLYFTWKSMVTIKFITLSIYTFSMMGILGCIYTTLLLPRALYCNDMNILTCIYSPI